MDLVKYAKCRYTISLVVCHVCRVSCDRVSLTAVLMAADACGSVMIRMSRLWFYTRHHYAEYRGASLIFTHKQNSVYCPFVISKNAHLLSKRFRVTILYELSYL